MIDLIDAINFFQANKNQYYSLWTFYFTASAGILGFVYGNDFARKHFAAKVIATILYFIVINGNSTAIFSTQEILEVTKNGIIKSFQVNENNESKNTTQNETKDGKISVEFKEISQKLQITNLKDVKQFYWAGTALVFVGIWFMDLVLLLRKIGIGKTEFNGSEQIQ